MVASKNEPHEIVGRVAYIDPSNEWGYLHGPVGERVYFRTIATDGQQLPLDVGAEVRYRLSGHATRTHSAQIIQCMRPGR
jgi:hypothetical protein